MKTRIRIIPLLLASIISLFTFGSVAMAAPAKTIIRAVVRDSATKQPEIGAVIQFFKADDPQKPVAYALCDDEGAFEHAIDGSGDYILVFTNVGRKEFRKEFSLSGQPVLDLGFIEVEDDVQMLEAGKVVALKDLVKMDVGSIVYKVSDDVDSKSMTLLDMLRKVPMVTVDGQDKITVNGSSSFQVLVDGRPNVMMSSNPSVVFKALPASFAKNIEVVTNPGVKYDAEGVGGVLNITTAGNLGSSAIADGYNANISIAAGTKGSTGSGFVTLQKGKLSASANVSVVESNIKGSSSEVLREQLASDGSVLSTLTSSSTGVIRTPVRLVSASLGYEIDDRRLVSATVGYNGIDSHSTNRNTTSMSFAGAPSFGYSSDTKSIWDVTSYTGSVDYQRSFKDNPDRLLTMSYLFSGSPSDTDSETIFGPDAPGMTSRYNDGVTNTVQQTLQADYTTKISGATFNAGAKYISRRNKSDQNLFLDNSGSWIQDMAGSLKYRHDNQIAAAYSEMGYNFGKYGMKAGLRYEHTFQNVRYILGNGDDFKLDYGNLVPAASLQYNISPTQNVGLSYAMRISRPGITYLNPYVDVSDPAVKSYGNPDLETEKAHNISMTYNYLSQKVILNATLRHNYTGNGIEQYSFYDGSGILNSTYGNIASRSTTGLTGMLMLNAGKTTRLVLTGGLDYNDIRSSARALSNSGWSGNMIGSLQTTLPKDIRFSSNLIWMSGSKTLDGHSSGISIVTGGLTKSILDDRITLGINATSPIDRDGCLRTDSFGKGEDYRQTVSSRIPMSTVTFNITWNFGTFRNAAVKKTRKTITNDDLIDRSNSSTSAQSLIAL